MLDGIGSVSGDLGPQTTCLAARDLARRMRAAPDRSRLDGRQWKKFLFGDEHAIPSVRPIAGINSAADDLLDITIPRRVDKEAKRSWSQCLLFER
jgi:hypothetical protein